jgi:hypothetical protein
LGLLFKTWGQAPKPQTNKEKIIF